MLNEIDICRQTLWFEQHAVEQGLSRQAQLDRAKGQLDVLEAEYRALCERFPIDDVGTPVVTPKVAGNALSGLRDRRREVGDVIDHCATNCGHGNYEIIP